MADAAQSPGHAGGYLFAYGSLIQRAARVATVPSGAEALPAIAHGIRRSWCFQYEPENGPTLSPTYLGAYVDAESTCNGVILRVPPTELDGLAWRELGYLPLRLDCSAIEIIDGSATPDDAEIWFYATQMPRAPSELHPIVQSYVDICIGGCLEIEEEFPAARAASFARTFIETTHSWQAPWVNDRLLPWRPSVHEPRAWDIDDLLHAVLGADVFGQIRVPRV
jgi:hypothetical protein